MRKLGLSLILLVGWTAGVAGVTWHLARVDQPTRLPVAAKSLDPEPVVPAPLAQGQSPMAILPPDQPPAPKVQPGPVPEPHRKVVPAPEYDEEFESDPTDYIDEESEPVPEPAPRTPAPGSFEPLRVNGGESTTVKAGTGLDSIHVGANGVLNLPAGEVTVRGNITGGGKIVGGRTSTLILEGNQDISTTLQAGTAIIRGGTKRLTAGASSRNTATHAAPGQANLIIEAGATLIIEQGGVWDSRDAYAYQVAGTLMIDGGTFRCTFANNSNEFNDCWLPGSSLIIRNGRFVGSGDHDFSGANISIYGGSLEVDDDIWHSGDRLEISGGMMRNSTGGGMFAIAGSLRMTGGKLQAYQSYDRGLHMGPDSMVFCTGGDVEILGSAANHEQSGIVLRNAPTIARLVCHSNTRIHAASPAGSSLTLGELVIAKGRTFNAVGFPVSAPVPDPEGGTYVP